MSLVIPNYIMFIYVFLCLSMFSVLFLSIHILMCLNKYDISLKLIYKYISTVKIRVNIFKRLFKYKENVLILS